MPTNRKRTRREYTAPIREDFANFLLYGIEPGAGADFDFFLFKNDRDRQREIWENNRSGFMSQWLKERPCSRPHAWWQFNLLGYRKMVGGSGIQAHDNCNYKQSYEFGVPKYWKKIDEQNPPIFESQTEFLKRRGLLNDGEVKLLSENPELLQSEKIFNTLDPRIVLDVSNYK